MEQRIAWARSRCEARGWARFALVSMYDIENNAVRILAAGLRRAGHHCTEIYFKDWRNNHIDLPTPSELDHLVHVLQADDIDIVGFSIRASAYYKVTQQLTQEVHSRTPLPVFWGGNHPTLVPDKCMPHAEILIRGESDDAIVEVANALCTRDTLHQLGNLWVKDDAGNIYKNELRTLIPQLDGLPFRDYTSPDKVAIMGTSLRRGDPMVAAQEPVFQMMASRGCIFRCAYCYNSTYQNELYAGQKFYRTRSVGSMIQEIHKAREVFPRMKRVRFDDEVFNFNTDWLAEFLERYPREVGLPFDCFMEPQLVTEDKMAALKKAGLINVFMGVQNAETVNGDLYDRRSSDKHIQSLAQLYHRLGISIHYQLIFDDPVATAEDKEALFELVSSFPRPYDLYLFSMTIFPESALEKKLKAMGLITDADVEGENTRTFYQHRVDLNFPRPPEDTFWIALIVLLSKPFVPISLIRALSKSEQLKKDPRPLVRFAQAANFAKMGMMATRMLKEGELTTTLVHRWLNMDSLITA
ncbi:MAG: B12-binding domain-containing radical SAM protein [Myxococcota bacterium]